MTRIKITKELILNLYSLNLSKKQVATHLEIPISILNQGLEQLQLKKLKFNKEDLEILPDLELPEVIDTHTFTMYEEEPVSQPSTYVETITETGDVSWVDLGLGISIRTDMIENLPRPTNINQVLTQTSTGEITWSEPVLSLIPIISDTSTTYEDIAFGNPVDEPERMMSNEEWNNRELSDDEIEEIWEDEELEDFLAEQQERDRLDRNVEYDTFVAREEEDYAAWEAERIRDREARENAIHVCREVSHESAQEHNEEDRDVEFPNHNNNGFIDDRELLPF